MARDVISPMLDVMFKQMFSEKDSAPMLSNFLETFLDFKGEKITDVELTNKELAVSIDDKRSFLDLRVMTNAGEIDVEVQLKSIKGDRNRFSYYLSKMFTEQATPNTKYNELHKCKSLLVLDYTMPEYDEKNGFYHSFKMRDENGITFSDILEIGVIEIPRIRNLAINEKLTDREMWAKLLAAKSEEELDMVEKMTTNSAIQQAVFTVRHLSADEKMRRIADERRKVMMDEQWKMASERDEGKAEGRAEERMAIVANLRAMGMPEEQIKMAMGISTPHNQTDYSNETDEDEDEEFEP